MALPRGPGRNGTEKLYEPLRDEPHLFLDFARLHEKDAGTFVHWVDEYGLLGLQPKDPWLRRDTGAWTSHHGYEDLCGPAETMNVLINEAKAAKFALCLYEAALSRDEGKLVETLFDDTIWGEPFSQALLYIRTNRLGSEGLDALEAPPVGE